MSVINAIRSKYKEDFYEKHGVKLGYMSFFTRSVSRALEMFPQVNSMIDGDDLVSFDYVDISIAVSSPKGLVVPVLRNAQKMNFHQIEQEVQRLANKAREGSISIDDMIGGTFTITNGGVFGSMLSTPIINPPQSAILAVAGTQEELKLVNGEVQSAKVCKMTITCDHRVIDGALAAEFMNALKDYLETPAKLIV